ncbi:MAG: hypothetical protein Ta2A_25100 [Treponemataceae bacterium]|nr:MAG: hypothetical protein Ta2A_25100 [Treponemataceae bacterium]
MSDMNNRREERFEPNGKVDFSSVCASEGELLDISVCGCRAVFPEIFELDTAKKYQFTVKSPKDFFEESVTLEGRPLWVTHEADSTLVGFELSVGSNPDELLFVDYIKKTIGVL